MSAPDRLHASMAKYMSHTGISLTVEEFQKQLLAASDERVARESILGGDPEQSLTS
jgi:hypothetical protein